MPWRRRTRQRPRLCSVDAGLWRDVLAFTWTIKTMSGRAAIEATLRETMARTRATNFHIPAERTPPRWVSRAGTECIEAIFEFETAFGPVQRRPAACARGQGSACAPGR